MHGSRGNLRKKMFLPFFTLFLTSMTLFWSTPRYIYFLKTPQDWDRISESYIYKSQHLSSSLSHISPRKHEAKFVFRFTVPLLIKLTGLNPFQLYPLKCALGFLILLMCWLLTCRILDDRVSATLLSFGVTFIYFGRAGFVTPLFFDCIPFFFALCALYTKQPLLIFVYCFVCVWTDERAFLALPIIILFHQLYEYRAHSDIQWPRLFTPGHASLAVILSMAAYVGLRLLLALFYGMHTPSAGVGLIEIGQNIKDIPIGIWTFLEGFWFVVLLSLAAMARQRLYLLLLFSVCQLLALTIAAIAVNDVTRSGAYIVPFVFVAIVMLKDQLSQFQMRTLLLIAAVLSFVFPAIYVLNGVHMQFPLFFEPFRQGYY